MRQEKNPGRYERWKGRKKGGKEMEGKKIQQKAESTLRSYTN